MPQPNGSYKFSPEREVCVLLRRLHGIDQIDVDGFVTDVRRDVRLDFPVQTWRQKLVGGGKVLCEIGRVKDLTGPDLPGIAQLCREAIVKTAEFEVAHVIDGTLVDFEADRDGGGGIVELSFRSDRGTDIAPGAVQLLDVFQ